MQQPDEEEDGPSVPFGSPVHDLQDYKYDMKKIPPALWKIDEPIPRRPHDCYCKNLLCYSLQAWTADEFAPFLFDHDQLKLRLQETRVDWRCCHKKNPGAHLSIGSVDLLFGGHT